MRNNRVVVHCNGCGNYVHVVLVRTCECGIDHFERNEPYFTKVDLAKIERAKKHMESMVYSREFIQEIYNDANKEQEIEPIMAQPIEQKREEIKIEVVVKVEVQGIKQVIPEPIPEPVKKKKKKRRKHYSMNKELKQSVLKRDKYRCQKCNTKNRELHVHHIIHRKDGGTDVMDNLITLCAVCHALEHQNDSVFNIMKQRAGLLF